MKRIFFLAIVVAVALQNCQACDDPKSPPRVLNNVYRNEALGFVYPIPHSYNFSAAQMPNPDGTYTLLVATKKLEDGRKNRIWLITRTAKDKDSAGEHVKAFIQAQTLHPGITLVRKPSEMTVAKQEWYRADYDEVISGRSIHHSLVSTRRSDTWIDWKFSASSNKELQGMVFSLSTLQVLGENKAASGNEPGCVTVVGRIRATEHAMQGRILHRASPVYPTEPGVKITGTVVLDAIVSPSGKVMSLKLVSGHPMLVPAAIEAAKQYLYSPYYLNEESIEVSTQISIDFTPPTN